MSEKNRTQRVIESIEAKAAHAREVLREQYEGLDIGTSTVSDAEYAMWFEWKTGRVPLPRGIQVDVSAPKPLVVAGMPTQMVPWADPANPGMQTLVPASVVMSPWEAALNFVEGGKELLDRYQRAVMKRYQIGMVA